MSRMVSQMSRPELAKLNSSLMQAMRQSNVAPGVRLYGIDMSHKIALHASEPPPTLEEEFQDLATWELEHCAPSILVYTPPGKHYIQPSSFSKSVWIHSSDGIAETMDRHLQRKRKEFEEGLGPRPIVDLDHLGTEMAEPLEFFYDQTRGMMLRVRWLKPGAMAVLRGVIYSFSPAYLFVNGEFSGFEAAVGSVLSTATEPAIRNMPPIRPLRVLDEHKARRDLLMSKVSKLVGSRINEDNATVQAFDQVKTRYPDLHASYEFLKKGGA